MRIMIATIALFAAATSCRSEHENRSVSPAQENGFTTIFDGKTLEGWDGHPDFWSVEDGAITAQTSKENPLESNTFIIWREGELADFELKIEYRIFSGNSGIQYRSFQVPQGFIYAQPDEYGYRAVENAQEVEGQKWVIGGYQADLDFSNEWAGITYGEKFRNILAKRGEKVVIGEDGEREVVGSVGDSKELQSEIKKQDWNEYHIIAKGNLLVQKINDVVMSELTDNDKIARARGLLALQLHTGAPMKVQFRNIRVKHLSK